MRALSVTLALLGVGIVIGPSSTARAAEPPREPILRIEAGMHHARISRIGVDAEERYVVTGSLDKTVRVWGLATGRLLKVLRLPIGEGLEGHVDAVALSPDGRTIAAGGWTGREWDKTTSIYVFDRESGRLLRRLAGLPAVILHLAYSPDGRFLVATLHARGIRLYRTSDFALVGEDRAYGDSSYWAAFDPKGRLVTSCDDGFVRLYDLGMNPGPTRQPIAKRTAPGGNHPFGVAFSPDGSKVAVGYDDSTKVDVLSGTDLAPLYAPDTRQVSYGNLGIVAWSLDGRLLYAGGRYGVRGSYLVRTWANGGRVAFRDLPVAANTILHIVPLKGGGIAVGASDPRWSVLDAQGRQIRGQDSPMPDLRNNLQGLLVSRDGTTIQFGYESGGTLPARFSVVRRVLALDPPADGTLAPPLTTDPGLTVTDWQDSQIPKLNGTPLTLEKGEKSRSLAIAPDQQTFLLGADWSLRLFDRVGAQRWQIPTTNVWGVNIAADGQVAVTALADGTLRWYRLQDGRELLALFPHADRKRWVLWTPRGLYDASPGGEDLIGWHVNRGAEEAADFFPASRFRSTAYRPDVVAKVLETRDEAEAIRRADAEAGRQRTAAEVRTLLPPVVEVLAPRDGAEVATPEVTVELAVRTPSGEPVTGIKALIDGRPVVTERGLQIAAADRTVRQVRVAVPERDAEVSIVAENRYAASEPVTVRLKWRGAAPFVTLPRLYVLAVGVSQYDDRTLTLGLAAKDARDFAAAVAKQQGGLYRDVVVRALTDAGATRDAILGGLDWLEKQTTSKDVAMVFLAGHGVNDANGAYYFLPVNVKTDELRRTAVPFSELKQTVAALAGKTLLFVDTCHSGNIMGTRRGAADITAVANELASAENGAVVFASSTGRQFALEDASWGNGAFTKALVEAVNGAADYQRTGKITVNMVDLYLSERVKELTRGQQTPTTTKPQTIADFPVALKR